MYSSSILKETSPTLSISLILFRDFYGIRRFFHYIVGKHSHISRLLISFSTKEFLDTRSTWFYFVVAYFICWVFGFLYMEKIILHNKFVVRRKTEYFCLYAVHKSAIGNAANLHLLWYQNKKGFAPRDECVLPVLYTVTQL